MHKPKQVVIKGKLLDEFWKSYLDSLNLEKEKDLTEWGKGEMFVFRKIFELF